MIGQCGSMIATQAKSAFSLLLEGDHSPSDLNPLLDPTHLQRQFLFLDECPELRFIIKDIVVVPNLINPSVISRNRYVSYSNLAFVPPTDLYPISRNVLDDHHVIGFLRNTLQHNMLTNRLLNWKQLVFNSVLFNETRVFLLTHLTEKFLKIVLNSAAHHFLLHLGLIPLLKTMEVHKTTGSTTLAGLTQKLTHLCPFGKHTVFTL